MLAVCILRRGAHPRPPQDSLMNVYESERGDFERSLRGHTNGVTAIAFNSTGTGGAVAVLLLLVVVVVVVFLLSAPLCAAAMPPCHLQQRPPHRLAARLE